MSVEKLTNRQLAAAVGAKVVGDVFAAAARVAHGLGSFADDLGDTAFMVEQHAAKRYESLTGTDLGAITGDPDRYDEDAINAELFEEGDEA